jgi:hypothetical protein
MLSANDLARTKTRALSSLRIMLGSTSVTNAPSTDFVGPLARCER